MKVTFLGTSHGITEKNRFCSSIAVTVGNNNYVIDAGAPITTLLQNYDIPFKSVKGIFITHPHNDHYIGLVYLTSTLSDYGEFKDTYIDCYVSDDSFYKNILRFNFGDENYAGSHVRYHVYGESGVIFDDGVAKITVAAVNHCKNSRAFLFEAEGKRLVFCGDLSYTYSDYPRFATEAENDLVVVEGAHAKLTSKSVLKATENTKTKKLILTHCYDGVNDGETVKKFFSYFENNGVECLKAYDGLAVEI